MGLPQEEKGLFNELYNRVEGFRAGKPGVGKVFWVDNANGSDTLWNGLRPTLGLHKGGPFATITQALTQCANYEDDYILVLRGGGETYPIAVAVDRVHIIGITNIGTPQTVGGYLAGATACMTIDANHVELAGLTFLTNGTLPAIDVLGQCWGLWVHHCSLGSNAPALHGIFADNEGPIGGLIEHNLFGAGIVTNGCQLLAPTRTNFRRNLFRFDGGICILVNGGTFGEIWENKFMCQDANGAAVTVTGGDGLVVHNWATNGKLATFGAGANHPFTDTGTNHWSDNWENNAAATIN